MHADALILAGDIFDAWIGDDAAIHGPEPWLQEALEHLSETAKKIPLFIGHGNRDFLMGPALARRLGATLMPESALFHTDAGPVHISHGDELCTHDLPFHQTDVFDGRRPHGSLGSIQDPPRAHSPGTRTYPQAQVPPL